MHQVRVPGGVQGAGAKVEMRDGGESLAKGEVQVDPAGSGYSAGGPGCTAAKDSLEKVRLLHAQRSRLHEARGRSVEARETETIRWTVRPIELQGQR